MARSVIKKHEVTEVQIGQTVILGGQNTIVGWLGWQGKTIMTRLFVPNEYVFPSGTYTVIRMSNEQLYCQPITSNYTSPSNITDKISSFAFIPLSNRLQIDFEEAPFTGTNNAFVLLNLGLMITRTA